MGAGPQQTIAVHSWIHPGQLQVTSRAGASCGKRLDTRPMTNPMISGVHFSLGYFFGQLHLWIGVDAYRQTETDLKFLKLEKL